MLYHLCMREKYCWPAAVFTKLTFSTALCLYLEQRILHSRKINVENVGGRFSYVSVNEV